MRFSINTVAIYRLRHTVSGLQALASRVPRRTPRCKGRAGDMEDRKILRVVGQGEPVDRLAVAAAHVELAIAHINNHAQARIPYVLDCRSPEIEHLQLLVRALADIRDDLRRSPRPAAAEVAVETPQTADTESSPA